ncbi:phosphoribosylamine--glycine ligase [Candidatus Pelagibacter sp.]|jgi:phosphoribosylamine--glycine ligase|nr:phosphoribosylamine--glycine ligase [Candidatus Pelagibacter sp.]
MKIAVIGSGGREHAICMTLLKSKKINKIYCFPGNAGTSRIATNINIKLDKFLEIKKFIINNKINLVVVGPEKPLVDGLVDYLQKYKIKVFGPNKRASQLEGSKIFTKKLCKKFKIPTAKFAVFKNPKKAILFIKKCNFPLVIKADGLAAGKGVYICENKKKSFQAINEIFDGKFGLAKNVLIEEFLEGEEMSFFIICDGKNYLKFGTAQDHKRALEGDKGKNTGGMGAYSPSRLDNEILNKKILKKIINPTLMGLKKMNINYTGFLYAGLMVKNNEPYLIEYNVRMGDPECQTILPKLKTELIYIIESCLNKKLKDVKIKWHKEKSLCVVLCSKGYPEKFSTNKKINLERVEIKKNDFIFHAGTKIQDKKIVSNGGRVLNVVVKSNDFKKSRIRALNILKNLDWNNGYYRRDIGSKVID